MTQPANPTPQAGPGGNPTAPPEPPKPPWGDDANFDAQKAWTLLQAKEADKEKLKAQVAELTPFQQRVKEMEDAAKTEAQKLTEQLAAAQKTAADNAAALLRMDVAMAHGISKENADLFLTGTDQETLAKQAAALKAMSGAPQAGPASTTPVEQLRPGGLPTPPPASIGDQIAAAEKAKDWTTAMRLKNAQLLGQFGQQT